MADYRRIADILFCSWTVANGHDTPLPTGPGVLDRALKTVIDAGLFSDEIRQLRFIEGHTGLRCPELGRVLSWAQASELTSNPNPSYSVTVTKVDELAAESILQEISIDLDEAKAWGAALADAVNKERRSAAYEAA